MGIIDEDMRRIVDSARLGVVATICDDSSPNLSPNGTVRVYDDDHLVFMTRRRPPPSPTCAVTRVWRSTWSTS